MVVRILLICVAIGLNYAKYVEEEPLLYKDISFDDLSLAKRTCAGKDYIENKWGYDLSEIDTYRTFYEFLCVADELKVLFDDKGRLDLDLIESGSPLMWMSDVNTCDRGLSAHPVVTIRLYTSCLFALRTKNYRGPRDQYYYDHQTQMLYGKWVQAKLACRERPCLEELFGRIEDEDLIKYRNVYESFCTMNELNKLIDTYGERTKIEWLTQYTRGEIRDLIMKCDNGENERILDRIDKFEKSIITRITFDLRGFKKFSTCIINELRARDSGNLTTTSP